MTRPAPLESERERQLNEILLAFVEALEQGQAPDRARLLSEHPEFASDLADFLACRDRVESLAAPLRQAACAGRASEALHRLFPWGPSALPGDGSVSGGSSAAGRGTTRPAADQVALLGDFRLLREVGRGGMGIVYEAEQVSLNRRVALKVLRFVAALDPKQLERFKNEALAAALLHHPHIVAVHAVGCERGVHYYTMQFIEGQSLAAMIQELRRSDGGACSDSGLLSPSRSFPVKSTPPGPSPNGTSLSGRLAATQTTHAPAAAISTQRAVDKSGFFRQVARLGRAAAEALEHAHQLGVVHRDIKPANILLDGRGSPWIADFGLALLQSDPGLTTSGELVGTLRYMSPEQARGQRRMVDHRTDIYSLGATLYELLALAPLFEGQDRQQLLHQIASEEPRSLRSVDRTIPLELETIVLKCLAKNPAERYATAQELADDLQRFLEYKPVRARRPTLLDRATKWSRRHKPVVFSALVLLLSITAGLLVSTVLIARAHREAKAAYQRERREAEEARRQRRRAEDSFIQARRAVDFFTQVSEEELLDRSDVLEVRRTLLEGALQYYQEFIDQHRDDPSIRAELAASRARVAQILDELSAQRHYFDLALRASLLADRPVQDDLKLQPAQAERIAGLTAQLAEQRRTDLATIRMLPREEQGRKLKALAQASEQAIAGVLTARQARRLRQIALQQQGLHAFDEPDVAAALKLTRDQKNSLRTIEDNARRALWTAYARGRRRGEALQQAEEAWRAAEDGIAALLTQEQEAAWKEITGQPFRGGMPWLPRPPRSRGT